MLTFIGATEGFAEGLWLVALLSLVEPGGKNALFVTLHTQALKTRQIKLFSTHSSVWQWHSLEIWGLRYLLLPKVLW